jgi:GAF domain-containing protein
MSEAVRLQAVEKFKQLDLQLDSELQDLITMASEICDTPIALITLLDEDTQWIKVKKGMDAESTPRESSFCTHTIQQENVFMITDTHTDMRLANHPGINSSKLRFYAGAPLITRDGLILGTLCVADNKPHILDKHQMLMLKMLSKQAINIMELKLSYDELEKSKLQAIEHKEAIDNAEIRLRSCFLC